MSQEVKEQFLHIRRLLEESSECVNFDVVEEINLALLDLSDAIDASGGAQQDEVVRLRNELGLDMILESEIARRIWEKPLGYAGDWVTLGHLMEMQAPSPTIRGKLIDHAILRMPAVQSVRERPRIIARQIDRLAEEFGRPLRVLGIASGPAVEIWDVFASNPGALADVHLFDIDPSAIAHSATKANALGLADRVEASTVNIIKLALGDQPYPLADFDFVYSMGLTDYFPDELVVALLNSVHAWLAPGGCVVLGNFHPRNGVAHTMAAFGWELIHRTEAEMHQLFASSAFGSGPHAFLWDDQKIDLFSLGRR